MSANPSVVDPSKLKLVLYPHPTLLTRADEVPINENGFLEPDLIRSIAARMEKIMRSMGKSAIGLSANQVGLTWRIFVCLDDLNNNEAKERACRAYINPKIISSLGMEADIEGCLSFPGVKGAVSRPSTVHMEYYDLDGHHHTVLATGLQARCFQHEIDHLDGINIIDKFNDADRNRTAAAIRRLMSK